ncbi:ROK family protein [Gallibacterium anatis]|uniref:ROK family protein n=1 Tax=Gallibacterium anatis TaxID=750 RepID=UPI0038B40C69
MDNKSNFWGADHSLSELFIYALDTKFVRGYLQYLAKSIAMVVNLFDPDCIVLGGGVMDMENFPYQQLKQNCLTMIRKPLPYNKIEFYQAQSSDFNGAIGAALRAIL